MNHTYIDATVHDKIKRDAKLPGAPVAQAFRPAHVAASCLAEAGLKACATYDFQFATRSKRLTFACDLVDELHLLVYPITLGTGKRALPNGLHATFGLNSATPYPSGVVGLHYARHRAAK